MQWKSTGPEITFELSKLIFSCYYVTRDSYPFYYIKKSSLDILQNTSETEI